MTPKHKQNIPQQVNILSEERIKDELQKEKKIENGRKIKV